MVSKVCTKKNHGKWNKLSHGIYETTLCSKLFPLITSNLTHLLTSFRWLDILYTSFKLLKNSVTLVLLKDVAWLKLHLSCVLRAKFIWITVLKLRIYNFFKNNFFNSLSAFYKQAYGSPSLIIQVFWILAISTTSVR